MRHDPVLSRASVVSTPVFLAAVLAACVGCTSKSGDGPGTAASVPAPLAPPSADIVAYAAVQSLDAALQGAADVARRVSGPGAEPLTVADLRAQVGAMLGDPQLEHLDGTKPIVVAVLKAASANEVPPVVALIPAKEGAPYGQQLSAMGMQSRFAGGLLAVAQTPEALEAAPKAQAVYDRIQGAKLSRTARVFLDADVLAGIYGETLKAGVAQLASLAGGGFPGIGGEEGAGPGKAIATILKLEVLGLLSVLGQSDALQLDVDWGAKGFDLDAIAAAKPGSELGGLFTKSAALRAPPASLISAAGAAITASMAIDPAGSDAFLAKILKDLAADPDAASLLTADTRTLMTSAAQWWKGTGVFAMGASEKALTFSYEFQVASEEKFLEMFQRSLGLLSPGSALGDMYKGMGVEMTPTLEKDARKHSGVAVHRYKMATKIEGPGFQPGAKESEMMTPFLDQELEMAVAGGRALVSGTPAELDRMIDAALAGKEGEKLALEALEVFGPGRQAYVDYEMLDLLKIFMGMRAGTGAGESEDMKEMTSKLTPTTPMTFAVTCGEARAQLQMRFPMEIIEKLTQLAPRPPAGPEPLPR